MPLKVIRTWFHNNRKLEKYLERTDNEENLKKEKITECPFCKVPFNGLDDKDHYQNCLKEPKINAELSTKSENENAAQNNLAQIPFPVSSTPQIIPEVNTNKCTLCEKMFKNSLNLEEHIRGIHLREKTQICDLCSLAFDSKQERNKHIEVSHRSDSEPVTSVTENQKEHRNNESEEKKKFYCGKCSFWTYYNSHLKDYHFKTMEYKSNKKYSCDQCNFTSCTRILLTKHNKKVIHELTTNNVNQESNQVESNSGRSVTKSVKKLETSVSKSSESEYKDPSDEESDTPVIKSNLEKEQNDEKSDDDSEFSDNENSNELDENTYVKVLIKNLLFFYLFWCVTKALSLGSRIISVH